jgi:hypothetical protein
VGGGRRTAAGSPPAPLVELISGRRQQRQAEDGERED